MKIAIEGMVTIRDSVHELQHGLYDLEARLGNLNNTVRSQAKSFALLANANIFPTNVRTELIVIDYEAGIGKVSNRINKIDKSKAME